MKGLPPDRGQLRTEQRHDQSHGFDELSTSEAVQLMTTDHRAAIEAVAGAQSFLVNWIEVVTARVRRGGRLIYIGAGTSGRLGVLDASECPPTFQSRPEQVIGIIAGGDAALRRSSEGMEDDPSGARDEFERLRVNESDSVLGIAAGGTTPYVLGGLTLAKERGAATGLLTCVPRDLPKGCDHLIVLNTGPEILTGSTRLKAGSATKLALNILTTVMFSQLGKVHGNLMVDLRATNQKLMDRAIRIVRTLCPDLSREAAADALRLGGNDVKTTLVMITLGVDRVDAESRLAATGGRLRAVLEHA